MNTLDIYKLIRSDKISSSNFLGVFARDELPTPTNYPCCFILNTDERDKPGEHWLAIYFNESKQAEFFDPAGQLVEDYNLENYLNKFSIGQIRQNKQRIQDYFSNYCGHYCVFFIYFRSRNYDYNTILNMFDKTNLIS
jgi:hypothetical protein